MYVLRPGTVTIGAQVGSDLVLDHLSVSRRHAMIETKESSVTVEDLGSKNGTFVNGRRIENAELEVGDHVHFGSVVMLLEIIEAGDAEVAISLTSARPDPNGREERTGSRTPSELVGLSGRWLALLEALVLIDEPVSARLQRLLDGLGARGAALIRPSRNGSPIVLTAAGAPIPSSEMQDPRPTQEAGDIDGPIFVESSECEQADPVVLVISGEFPGRPHCQKLLAAAARLLIPLSSESAAIPVRQEHLSLVYPDAHVIGRSPSMLRVYEEIGQLVAGDLPVLISGETGVGKEHIASILHASSRRAQGPFVAVNCAAIPGELLEAELFGIGQGVATGVTQRLGKLQQAHGGVVFLDEIGDMAPALQAKLLRALQEMEVQPVGASGSVPIDVRLLSATNQSVEELLDGGVFRRDLFYRLAGYTLELPPLRRRIEDIAPLVEHFLRRSAAEVGKRIEGLSARALEALLTYRWPGNLRELQHEVRRLVYRCPDGVAVDSTMLSPLILTAERSVETSCEGDLHLKVQVEQLERRIISAAMQKAGGNKSEAARLLGLSRNGLLLKVERLGIEGG